MNFNPHEEGSVVISSESGFENACAILEEHGVSEPWGLTEYQFYSRMRYLEKKYKEAEKYGTSQPL